MTRNLIFLAAALLGIGQIALAQTTVKHTTKTPQHTHSNHTVTKHVITSKATQTSSHLASSAHHQHVASNNHFMDTTSPVPITVVGISKKPTVYAANSHRSQHPIHLASTSRYRHTHSSHLSTSYSTHSLAKSEPISLANASNNNLNIPIPTTNAPVAATNGNGRHSFAWANSIEQRLVSLVNKTISTAHYSNYRLGGTDYDPSHGIYVLDCSDYVDHLLNQANPQAYYSLVNSVRTEKPTTQDYYNFFNRLPYLANNDSWRKIDNVNQVLPGDILVFRYKNNYRSRRAGGHVMIVMNKPVRNDDVLMVRVADSASSGHSADTRGPHSSGIGIGTLLLKVDPRTDQLAAYSWRMGAPWKENVNFAIARPTNA